MTLVSKCGSERESPAADFGGIPFQLDDRSGAL
jgi:hypothetical protein